MFGEVIMVFRVVKRVVKVVALSYLCKFSLHEYTWFFT